MAGERPTKAQEAPDIVSQILTFPLIAHGSSIDQYVPLFQAEKDTIIEDARIRFGTLEGVALTAILVHAPSQTALSSGTAITTAVAVGSGGTANKTVVMPLITSNSLSTQVPTQNLIPGDTVSARDGTVTPGSTVGIKFSGAPSALNEGLVTLRISQKRK